MKNAVPTVFPLILMRVAGLPCHRLYPDNYSFVTAKWEEILDLIASLPQQKQNVQRAFDALLHTTTEPAYRTTVFNARKAFYQKNKLPSPDFFDAAPSQELTNLRSELEIWERKSAWPALLTDWYQHSFEVEL